MNAFIREADSGDAQAITLLSNQLGYTIKAAETAQNIQAIHESKNDIAYVAISDGTIVGWIHVFFTLRIESGSFCEIGGLVVHDQYRNMGVGRRLVEKAKTWSEEKATSRLRVRCNVKRKDAHLFYTQLGFFENKEQKVFEIRTA